MAKTTTRRGVKGVGQPRATRATTATATTTTKAAAVGDFEKAEIQVGKVTDSILMLAADADGMTFLINRAGYEFYIPHDNANYPAMVSTLLAAQSAGAPVAVKYRELGSIGGNRRQATAVAKGVHAVIAGGSF